MDIFEAISKRHSYRGPYKDIKIERESLVRIVETAISAPSGKNLQTTDFVIVDDSELAKQISKIDGANISMQQAKAFILCVIDREPEKKYGSINFILEDCSAAIENMLLAITALGYATVWIDGWLRFSDRADIVSDIIKLPADKKIQVLLPVGVPEKINSQPKKKDFNERVKFNTYK